ncbi:hypothetical protein NLX71_21820 [Paenibacillus sp. MZ04-78.2]|uniref:hypothetical protein n=1 Tax=Paenibacillus sp. MZ04-78.2 TaxID=2962034 RepID=UPI0020B88D47|nr:hypothetical protein [Paenibacillus sp. MZ04-78.2]MCP3775912.1 hypothetical protein [Paenibacillus sp. MZ04-78.2]
MVMGGLLFLLVILFTMYLLYSRSAQWKTVMSASGPEARDLQARHAFLKSKQVKCRVQSDTDAALSAIQTAAEAVDLHHPERLKLDVHAKDLHKAEALLQQYEEKQPEASARL